MPFYFWHSKNYLLLSSYKVSQIWECKELSGLYYRHAFQSNKQTTLNSYRQYWVNQINVSKMKCFRYINYLVYDTVIFLGLQHLQKMWGREDTCKERINQLRYEILMCQQLVKSSNKQFSLLFATHPMIMTNVIHVLYMPRYGSLLVQDISDPTSLICLCFNFFKKYKH